jgi:hypothetical protein
MKEEVLKEAYQVPRLEVRGIVLECGVIAVSSRVAISGEVEYVDYDKTVTEMQTETGKDIMVF